ncbi:MAG: M13 family metallopeptidase [Eubacterium sp.]|nr:M13 family metallopeptidase [Eubacterium sp.]
MIKKQSSVMKRLLAFLFAGMLFGTACLSGCSNAGPEKAASSAETESVQETAASSAESEAGQETAASSEEAEAGMDEAGLPEEEPEMPEIPDDVTGGKPWIASCIPGNVTADTETSPADDFYLYANKEWIVSNELPEGSPVTSRDRTAGVNARMREALAGEMLSGHDARQAQLLFNAFVNTEARDAAGCEPAKKVIDDIRSISTIEELNAFLLDLERSAGVPTFIKVSNSRDYNTHRWVTGIGLSDETFGATIGTMGMDAATVDPESDVYQARYALVHDVLTRAGFTDEEAKKAFEARLDLEKEILKLTEESGEEQGEDTDYTIDQLDKLTGNFPLRELAEERGYGSAETFEVRDASELRAAAELYTDEHIDQLRSYLICGYVLETAGWLDTKAFAAWLADCAANIDDPIPLTMPERNKTAPETALNLIVEIAPTLVGRAYVEAYDLTHIKEFITNLTVEAVEAHKKNINASAWLSDDSKKQLTGKLDAMGLDLVYPDVWEDYSGLDIEGLGYYGARRAIWLNDLARNASLTGTEIDDRLWEDPSILGGVGAYNAENNSFVVSAGAVEEEVVRYEAGEITLEELMGGITGYTLFHEPAHALDPADIFKDAEGKDLEASLLTPADLEEYQRRTDKITKYFDGISVWEGQQVDGSVCTQEALAEICGMQARLTYAAGQNEFDYKRFFETRARLAASLHTPEYALACIMGMDRHPLLYLDTNVTFQQFDEFNDAFDVKEGDAMYLAPDERLVIW